MRLPRRLRRSLLLAALLSMGLAAAISCSLVGLADAPLSSSSSGSGGGAGASAADAGTVYEAEDAQVVGAYVILSDPDASNGKYVVVPADAGSCSNDDYIVFNVTADADGTYLLWTRIRGTGLHNDTFFVQTDMGPTYEVRTSVLGQWVEDAVFDTNAEVKTPIHYAWEAGAHQIILICRATDVSIDRLRLERIGP
jgi:hypothetical protein